MKEDILFSERQRFKQIWLWVLLLGINAVALFGFITQVFFGKTFGDEPASNGELAIVLALVTVISFFMYSFRLDTSILKDGIYYRFLPFQKKFKKIEWQSISKAYVRRYRPLIEYGGWGIRFGPLGTAYNISGNKGLQLVLNSGKKFLLGTQKPEELERVLSHLGQIRQ